MINYFERQLAEFGHAIRSLNEKDFVRWVDEAVRTLKSGHKIIVSGLGKNVPICEKFVGTMVSMGLDACFLHTNSAIHGDIGIVKKGDMVILLTKSGETCESIYLAELMKERDVSIWLLTFTKESTLTKAVPDHIVLDLIHEGDLWNIMPNNSTTINLIVLQGFAMKIADCLEVKLEQFKKNHPGGRIGELLNKDIR